VSVNNGSNPQLATLLRRRKVTEVPHYLSLLEEVWQLEWHKAAAPADAHQRKAWKRRAALLDSILYEEVE
jgi:predicted nucleic acid-binding protein